MTAVSEAQIALGVWDLFDLERLEQHVTDGYVRRQVHPTEPLTILNYTERAAYENVWDFITLTCRGLIYRTDTGEVVARPFRKFFNYGQAGSVAMPLEAPTTVTDKADGSLGILYPLPSGGWAVATRGSFASEQAEHATALLNTRYASYTPPAGVTVLCEIVYPENRIVLDYGALDDLILLGAIDIATGRDVELAGWPGPCIGMLPYASLAEALEAPPRPNAEGLVVYFPATGERLKLKQEDYVRLHRIVTGLTARTVWEHLVEGKQLADLIEPLPDEFHDWVRTVAAGIVDGVQREAWRLEDEYTKVRDSMPDDWQATDRAGRKDFAMVAAQHPDKWALFNLLDGKDIRGELLKRAKPEPYITPSGRIFTEDTA